MKGNTAGEGGSRATGRIVMRFENYREMGRKSLTGGAP